MPTPNQQDNTVEYLALKSSGAPDISGGVSTLLELMDFDIQPGAADREVSGMRKGVYARVRWTLTSPHVFLVAIVGDDDTEMRDARVAFELAAPSYFDWWTLAFDGMARQRTLDAYAVLHDLENELRQRISASMAARYGGAWWTHSSSQSAATIRGKCQNRKTTEENDPEHDFQPLHEIFFADFSDLSKIIDDATSWTDVFESVFKKKGTYYKLEDLSPLRNRVMHNRYLTIENSQKIEVYRRTLDRYLANAEKDFWS